MAHSLIAAVLWTAFAAAEGPQVPEGFTVEVVANFPQIQRPIFAHFDDVGRLYVGESSGENLNRAQMLEKKPHWITCLEDTNNDGVFDKSTRFVDNITLPQGMLWYRGSVYCACPPSIWKFTDTDGDGKADQREEILTGFGFNGNACDTHGPFLSPTGRLYIAQGRHGHEFKDKDGKTYSKGKAARIYSCRLDGSDVRVHCGGGFDNPVEIEFTEEGELLGTVNILYPNRGDCLMHWVEGGVYPREDQQDCISEFKWTGGLLGPIVDMGHVALSGLMRYRGTHFGPEYKDQLFVTEFNTHKVKRIALKRSGSTFAAEPMEFLTCPDGDFHPTDVLEDADGSLLVVDTGAWFLNGCPTSRVAKPEVTGAIYRIRKTDGEKINDPRGTTLTLKNANLEKLIYRLDDPRPAIREQAIEGITALVNRYERKDTDQMAILSMAIATGKSEISREAKLNYMWALSRANGRDSVSNLIALILRADRRWELSSAAIRALGDVPIDVATKFPLIYAAFMEEKSPQAILALCEVLARLATPGSRTAFDDQLQAHFTNLLTLKMGEATREPVLDHALIHAMTRIGPLGTFVDHFALKVSDRDDDEHPSTIMRRGLIIALDQMENSQLTAAKLTPMLTSKSVTLQKTVLEVLARHPGWAKEALGTIREWLGEKDLADDKANAIRTLLVSQANDPEVQQLIAEILTGGNESALAEAVLWEVLQRADMPTWPAVWSPLLQNALVNGDPQHQHVALRIIQRRELADHDAAIAPIADRTETPPLLRSEALTAMGPRLKDVDDKRFAFLLSQLEKDRDSSLKMAGARALAGCLLSGQQLMELAKHFDAAGPLVISTLLKAFERSNDDAVGAALVNGLQKSSVAESLSGDEVSAILRRYSAQVQQLAVPLIKQLGVDVEAQQARLTQLAPLITDGDAKAGERVFFGKKANCSACHAVAGKGARIGPDLSRIGQSRTGKDLLEAIVYPSASFVNGYRPHVAQLESGKTVQGIIAAEANDAVTFRTADLQEVRVLRKDIEELKESSTSIMPKGLDTQLTPDELRHLLAFLQARK